MVVCQLLEIVLLFSRAEPYACRKPGVTDVHSTPDNIGYRELTR